jgi:lambda repressor-like predicted transcriptional regulator
MELQEILNTIKLKKKHGLIRRVSQKTGVSMPTVKKYLDGDIINPKAKKVIMSALEEVTND